MCIRDSRVPDNTPEWYWGNGKPLSPSDDIKMPKSLNFPGRIHKDNTGVSSHKNNKHARKQKKDEVLIISDHIRQNVKDEIIWTWGKVKIRMANKTIQADKIKIDNKNLYHPSIGDMHWLYQLSPSTQKYHRLYLLR